ncbi:MAG: hypothetical protein RL654_2276 [Pseudomonadota bacterium]|jgi:hypothetical protein
MYRHTESEYEYRIDTTFYVVQCKGCKTISFRKVVADYENSYPGEDDEWEVPEDITAYPNVLKGHKELEGVWEIPDPVRAVYQQSVRAIRDDSNILAGIGLRATIEAICNERSIAGRTLDKRIDALAKTGLISQKDAERLHAIRFLGNDAAHEVRHSDSRSLLIALRIIEHLLVNLYVLDGEADSRLETIIKTPEKLLEVLDKKLKDFNAGDEIPLAKLFGKDVRRLHGTMAAQEAYLLTEIGTGKISKLKVGKVDHYAGSKDKLQHFVVV